MKMNEQWKIGTSKLILTRPWNQFFIFYFKNITQGQNDGDLNFEFSTLTYNKNFHFKIIIAY